MGIEAASYELIPLLAPDDIEGFDQEYFLYQLRKEVSEARRFLTEDGKSSGNAGDWRDIEGDLKPFSLKHPQVLMKIEASETYETTEEFHVYVQNGKSVRIEPVLTWPQFSTKLLA